MNKKQSLASIESIKTLYYIIDESNFSSQSNKKWQCISINLKWLNIKIKNKRLIHLNCHVHRGIQTLRSLSSVLFYQMTWSEFFQKVSIKHPGSQTTMSISEKNQSYCFISVPPRPIFGLYQRSDNFRMSLWNNRFSQNTNEKNSKISALASKERSIQTLY